MKKGQSAKDRRHSHEQSTWIRGVKSDLEISFIREAAAIADAGIMRAAEVIRPDIREAEAIAGIVGILARGANGKSGN